MPSMTIPLFGPSAIVTSMIFGDLDGSSFCVPTWITSSPFLTVCLRPSRVRMSAFSSPIGSFSLPVSLDSNVQVPWNFPTSFSRSAFSSAKVPDPPDAANPTAQNNATREIRIPVLQRSIVHVLAVAAWANYVGSLLRNHLIQIQDQATHHRVRRQVAHVLLRVAGIFADGH